MDLSPYFTKKFWERKVPIWQNFADDWGSLGLPAQTSASGGEASAAQPVGSPAAAPPSSSSWGSLFTGLLLGMLGYFLYLKRDFFIPLAEDALARLKRLK
jgi:hypothetical protein